MSATGYTVELWIGEWSATIDQDDTAADQLAAGAVSLAGLRVSWDSDASSFPAMPPPSQASLSLYVPADSLTKPIVFQGQTISVTITDPGWTTGTGTPPFVEFHGRIADADATPTRDGLTYQLAAVDYLADPSEEKITASFPGREPFDGLDVDVIRGVPMLSGGDPTNPDDLNPDTSLLWGRIARVFAASELPLTYTVDPDFGASFGYFGPVDAVGVTTAELLAETLLTGSTTEQSAVTGLLPNATKVPCLVQEVVPDPITGRPTLDHIRTAVTRSSPFTDAEPLPYVLESAAPPLLNRVLRSDASGWALAGFVLPASAAARSISWRQDKAAHPTRLELTGEMFVSFPASIPAEATTPRTTGYVLVNAATEAARGGIVGKSLALSAVYSLEYARQIARAHLGNDFDSVPRWSFDTVTFYPDQLEPGTPWPRMFTPAQLPAGASWQESRHALGRLVLVTGINPPWHAGTGDVPGRLTGATVDVLAGGRVACTVRVRHSIPYPNHGAVNVDDLQASGLDDRVPADFGDLTAYDLWLTDAPL